MSNWYKISALGHLSRWYVQIQANIWVPPQETEEQTIKLAREALKNHLPQNGDASSRSGIDSFVRYTIQEVKPFGGRKSYGRVRYLGVVTADVWVPPQENKEEEYSTAYRVVINHLDNNDDAGARLGIDASVNYIITELEPYR